MAARSFDVSWRQASSVSYFWTLQHSTGSEFLNAVPQLKYYNQDTQYRQQLIWFLPWMEKQIGGEGNCSYVWGLAWLASWPWPGLWAPGRGIWVPVWGIDLNQLSKAWVELTIFVFFSGLSPCQDHFSTTGRIYISRVKGCKPWLLAHIIQEVWH